MSWREFTQVASRIANEYGFPVGVLLGQAALETGYGTSYNAGVKNNWFGTGAFDSNPDNAYSFPSVEESIKYYIRNIEQLVPDWRQLSNNPRALIQAIKNAGYATDPDYVHKVTSLAEFKQNETQPTPTPTQGNAFGIQPAFAAEPTGYTQNPTPKIQNYQMPNYNIPTGQGVSHSPMQQYMVKAGDTLWDIAQKYMGGGSNWQQLGYQGNPRTMPIGTVLQFLSNLPQQNSTPNIPMTAYKAPTNTPVPVPTPQPQQTYLPYSSGFSGGSVGGGGGGGGGESW